MLSSNTKYYYKELNSVLHILLALTRLLTEGILLFKNDTSLQSIRTPDLRGGTKMIGQFVVLAASEWELKYCLTFI